jgi:Tfp pilus assembly protein PilF
MIALYEFLFFSTAQNSLDSVRTKKRGRRIVYLIPFFLTMLIISSAYIGLNIDAESLLAMLDGATDLPEESPPRLVYFLSQFGVITTYIRLLFMPIGQSIYYDNMVYHSFTLSVLLSFLFLVFVLGVGLYLYYRSRITDHGLRLSAFGIFWFFLALSVESSVLPITDVIFEYRVYLPSAGAFVAIASGVIFINLRLRSMQKAVLWAAIAVVLVLSGATYERNTVWQSEISLWEDTVRKAPNTSFGHLYLGKAYERVGLTDKAIGAYKKSIILKPEAVWTRDKLAAAYLSTNKIYKAIEQYRISAYIMPRDPTSYYNLGIIYQTRGLMDNAIQLYQIALEVAPNHAEAHNNLGVAYRSKGMDDKAIEHYRTALELSPDYAQAHYNLGLVYLDQGLKEEARGEFEEALRIDSGYIKARESIEKLNMKL